jgi:hypothetical protein
MARAIRLVLAVCALTETARAERNVELSWSAPAACPSREDVGRAIDRIVGAGSSEREPVTARVVVEARASPAWHAEIELASASGGSSTRSVDAESCQALADAVALMAAIAVDPSAAARSEAGAPAPATEPAAPLRGPLRDPLRAVAAGALLVMDGGLLPGVGLGPALAVAWQPSRLRLDATFTALLPRSATTVARPSEGADFFALEGLARGCVAVTERALDVLPCAGAGAAWISAHGFGSDSPSNGQATVGLVTVGALGTARIGDRFSLRIGGEGIMPLARPSFVIDPAGAVHRPPSVALQGSLGAELHF